jgi:hypothetical protein
VTVLSQGTSRADDEAAAARKMQIAERCNHAPIQALLISAERGANLGDVRFVCDHGIKDTRDAAAYVLKNKRDELRLGLDRPDGTG